MYGIVPNYSNSRMEMGECLFKTLSVYCKCEQCFASSILPFVFAKWCIHEFFLVMVWCTLSSVSTYWVVLKLTFRERSDSNIEMFKCLQQLSTDSLPYFVNRLANTKFNQIVQIFLINKSTKICDFSIVTARQFNKMG